MEALYSKLSEQAKCLLKLENAQEYLEVTADFYFKGYSPQEIKKIINIIEETKKVIKN